MLERNEALRQWPEPHSRPGSGGHRASPWPLAGPAWSFSCTELGWEGHVHTWTCVWVQVCVWGGTWTTSHCITQTTRSLAGQAPGFGSGPLSPVPGGVRPSRRPGRLRRPRPSVCSPEGRAQPSQGTEQAAQASLWPIFSPAPRPACANATWPRHASCSAGPPQARATVPSPPRRPPGPPMPLVSLPPQSLRFPVFGEMGPFLSGVVLNIHVLIKEFYCRSDM